MPDCPKGPHTCLNNFKDYVTVLVWTKTKKPHTYICQVCGYKWENNNE